MTSSSTPDPELEALIAQVPFGVGDKVISVHTGVRGVVTEIRWYNSARGTLERWFPDDPETGRLTVIIDQGQSIHPVSELRPVDPTAVAARMNKQRGLLALVKRYRS